ncbi:MAG TPA: ammonium transporter [Tepidisphaeraceae bacterium]|jgi:Amt family ammonium transporter|nr:ammonium transporter [Tepidisphaeraceae bacterium]
MLRALAASNRTLVATVFSLFCFAFVATPAHAADAYSGGVKIFLDKKADTGDTAWMLTSAALVLMMTGPGLALFYSGLVRRKNVLGTMMQSFVCMAVVSVLWAIVGYTLAFDQGTPFIGGFHFAFLRNVDLHPCEYAATIPHTTWMAYQMMFAVITPALICGAYAERMKFSAMLVFSSLWLLLIYCPMAHMVWGKGGLFNVGVGDAHTYIKALDFAGGTVVHVSSGVSALVCALVLGKRRGYGRVPMPPHSVVLSVIGAALLWVGWFGFNAGSALGANGLASYAFVNTHLAAAAAALGWMFIEWIKGGKPTVLGAISGAVAGLVVITPASGFTTPMYALLMGAIGGVACFFGATTLKHMFGYDDSLDAFGVHGIGGMVGAILTGIFAVAAINPDVNVSGLVDGNPRQVLSQLIVTLLTIALAATGSFILLQLARVLCRGLRVTESDEYDGLDLTQHGESGYNFEESFPGTVLEDSGPTLLHHHGHAVEPEGASV